MTSICCPSDNNQLGLCSLITMRPKLRSKHSVYTSFFMVLALYDVIGRLYPYMVNLRHRSPAHLLFKPSVVRGSQLSPYEMKDYSELFWSKELQYGAKSLLKKVIHYTLLITLLKSDVLRYLITLKKGFFPLLSHYSVNCPETQSSWGHRYALSFIVQGWTKSKDGNQHKDTLEWSPRWFWTGRNRLQADCSSVCYPLMFRLWLLGRGLHTPSFTISLGSWLAKC